MIKIRHTGIVTKNIKESLYFWCKTLGFKITKDLIESGNLIDKVLGYKKIKVRTIKLKDTNGNLIELLHFINPPKTKLNKIKPYSNGITHLSITVKNIDLIYRKLKKNNTKLNTKHQISADGNVKMTYCTAPEGSFLELVQEL